MSCPCGNELSLAPISCNSCNQAVCLSCSIQDDQVTLCVLCREEQVMVVQPPPKKVKCNPIHCLQRESQCKICKTLTCGCSGLCLYHGHRHCSYCLKERKKDQLWKCSCCCKTICWKCLYQEQRRSGRQWIHFNGKKFCDFHQSFCSNLHHGTIAYEPYFQCIVTNCQNYGCRQCSLFELREFPPICESHCFYCYRQEIRCDIPKHLREIVKYSQRSHMCSQCQSWFLFRWWALKEAFRNYQLRIPRDLIFMIIERGATPPLNPQ